MTASISPTTRNRFNPILGGLALAGLLVACTTASAVGARPDTTPSPAPIQSPPVASGVLGQGGGDAMPIRVDIATIGDDDVHVDIVDETGRVTGARSGPATAGASVEPYTLAVENVDPTTLRLTWVDYPIDNALALYVIDHDGATQLVLVQPEPTGDTDAIAFDRVMFLEFVEPISATDVVAILQDGLDTPG